MNLIHDLLGDRQLPRRTQVAKARLDTGRLTDPVTHCMDRHGTMHSLRIIGLSLLAAIVYEIAHDQVTARVCVEYFTIGHPPLIPSESPTLLALAWGVVATWWVGLPLGIMLAVAARAGRRPKLATAS